MTIRDENERPLDLARLFDSGARAAVDDLIATLCDLIAGLRNLQAGVLDDEALRTALWQLFETLSLLKSYLRRQLVIEDGEPEGLFCHWSDTTGMHIWRMLTAIESASEGVADVAYWLSRALEDGRDSDEPNEAPENEEGRP
jgi:hypothetical protein